MKAVILIDYLRQDYFNRSQQLDYSNSKTGKHFKSALAKFGFRENIDYYFDFVYSDIPQIKDQTDWGKILSYKVPRPQDKSLVPYYEALKQRIKENRPEVLVTTGPLGTYAVGDQAGSRYRVGVPTDTKVDGIPYYMIPLNSQEAVDFNPNIAYRRNNGLFALSSYKEKGPDAFEKGTYEHVFLSSFDRAKEVLKKAYQAPLVALDTETNSLEARAKGVKVLVFTLSYDGKTGYEIPIDHPDFTEWNEDQKHEIWELIAKIYANNHYKVMHNARYDLTFILTAKPEDVEMTYKHVIDTKIGYYLAIAQDEKESLRLTDLSKEITSLGGYDDPLEDFKTWVMTHLAKATYLKLKEGIKDKQSELDKKSPKYKVDKEAIAKDYCLEVSDKVSDSIMSSADIGLIEKYHFDMTEVKEKVLMRYIIPQVNQYREQKLHNPIDGNTFNYAWIPLSIMTPYATGDAVATYRCARWEGDYMRNDADDPEYKILHLWLDVYPRIVYGLVRVQHYGINLDTDYMHSLKESYQEEHERLIKAMAESPAGQATVEWKISQYQKGLAEFNKSKYKLAYDSAGNPKLKEIKEGNLAPELVDKYHYYDKLYTKWKESHKATYKGKKLPFPKDIASAGYRDEDIVKLRNAYKDDLKFSGKPADIGYALFHELHAEIPFEKDYFSDAVWKKFHSRDDVLWSDYSVSAKSTLKYVYKNGTEEQKEFANWGIQLSKVDTLRSDFTEKLDRMRSNLDGYIHGNFSETGTATSRLNGTHPNMQQIPSHTSDIERFDYKHPIKREFISKYPGGVLHNVDYANLEMRVAGLVSGDENMYHTFASGGDIHKETAALALEIPVEEVTKQQRQQAKSLVFGMIYGRSAASVAKQNGTPVEEAEEFEKKYLDSKPAMKKFIESTHEFVQEHGYVTTVPGFRRWLREIWSTDRGASTKALRQSVNTIIQGTGAFLTNNAVFYINQYFINKGMKSRVVLTVHDSVVVDSPKEEAYLSGQYAVYIMEHLPFEWLYAEHNGERVRYPIEAEDSIGVNYNDMVDFNPEDFKTFKSPQAYCKYNMLLVGLDDLRENGKFNNENGDFDEEAYNKVLAEIEGKKSAYQQQ